jgi:hypothetical protein
VNNAGEIAGQCPPPQWRQYERVPLRQRPHGGSRRPAGADHVVVAAISDQGVIVGQGIFPSGARSRVVTYQDGSWTDLGDMFGGGAAEAFGVNRFGQLVGRALTNGVWRAFLVHRRSGPRPDRAQPRLGLDLDLEPRGINDRSQIAANGSRDNGANQALVLFPATEIGRRVFRPEGAIGENPTITILQGAGTDRWDNSFFWSALERKLYAIRPVVAEIRWRTGEFATVTNDTSSVTRSFARFSPTRSPSPRLSFNVWPTDPPIHVAGAPSRVNRTTPASATDSWTVSYPTGEERVDATTKLFNTQTTGYSVLHYLRTDGRPPQNPENHPTTSRWCGPSPGMTRPSWSPTSCGPSGSQSPTRCTRIIRA